MSNISILEQFGAVKRSLNLVVTKELAGLKIGPKQALILRHLAKKKNCSQSELACATLTDPAAIGRGIESLLKLGWILRKDHPTDSRTWTIELSSKGKQRIAELEKSVERISNEFVRPLSSSERKAFLQNLKKVAEGLENSRYLSCKTEH